MTDSATFCEPNLNVCTKNDLKCNLFYQLKQVSTFLKKWYEKIYNDPFGLNSYQTTGFNKKNGKVTADPTMLSPHNILNLDAVSLQVVRQKASTPIITFNITEEEKSMFNTTNIFDIIYKYNEDAYNKYKSYKVHCWKVDTDSKCEKWGILSMSEKNAYSYSTNITENEKNMNTVMIYLYKNKIIINAWNGENNGS